MCYNQYGGVQYMDIDKLIREHKTARSDRPWGDIHVVVRNQPCSVDITHVRPGHRSSLHSHEHRAELFHFLDEGAVLEVNGELYHPAAHDEYIMKPGDKHRFWAEDNDFRMVVISFGEWDETDQIRHEDDYGREGKVDKLL